MVWLRFNRCEKSLGTRFQIYQSMFSVFFFFLLFLSMFVFEAFYRRASAYMALGKYNLALSDYEYVSAKDMFEWIGERFSFEICR